MFRHSLRLALVVAVAAVAYPRLSAQVDETQFFKKPTTPAEYWRAIQFELNVGKYDIAAELIRGLVDLNPTDKDLIDLDAREGLTPFLRLRNVERWSANPKLEAEARKNVETLIERIGGALKREVTDPKRIARFATALTGGTEEATFAAREIRRAGAAAIPVLAGILRQNPAAELREAILDLLPQLDVSTVPPLIAFLDVNDPTLKYEILEAIRRRPDHLGLPSRVETDVVPTLWYLSAPGARMPAAIRQEVTSMLAGQLQVDPAKRRPEEELTRLAERLYLHQATFANPNEPEVWRWDGDQLTVTPTSPSGAEEYFGLRYLRWALALRPNFEPAQVLFLSLATDKAVLRAGPDRPLSRANPVLYDLLASSPYDILAATLDRALRENRSLVVLGMVQVIGDRAQRDAARPDVREQGGRVTKVHPALLVRALNYPDRRVQVAAAEALLRIPGPPTNQAGPRIVEVLRDALTDEAPPTDAPARPKALLGDPQRFRAEAFAAMLRRLGFDVEIVPTGKALIRRVQFKPDADLLIVDHRIADPMLPDFLAQSRADLRTGALPLVVVASSEESSEPQLLSVLARLAVLIAVEGRDDPDVLRGSDPTDKLYRARVDVLIRARQDRLLAMAEDAGVTRSPVLLNRIEYVTLVANSAIFEKADIPRRIAELRPTIRPDFVEPSANRDRIDKLLRIMVNVESALPAELLARLDKIWNQTLQQLPPWPGVRNEILENRLRYLTRTYRNVKVIPDVFTEAGLRDELVSFLVDPRTAPLTEVEKRQYSLQAVEWLRRMAVGEVPGYDIRPAGRALRLALNNDELAQPALDAVARLGTPDAQQALANIALAGNRPMPLRIRAAEALVRHLQLHGNALGQAQIQLILEQASREMNPELQARFQVLEGVLRPNPVQTGARLQLYQPGIPAAAPQPPKEDIKEEPKEKKEEPKEKD